MLNQLCGYLRNYFEKAKIFGTVKIEGGVVTVTKFTDDSEKKEFSPLVGQYIRIVGSYLNDGVYKWTDTGIITDLKDETFDGAVWLLAIPKEVVDIAAEIAEWRTTYEKATSTPYSSESLSASSYSYSKASGDSIASLAWPSVFAARIAQWRKI